MCRRSRFNLNHQETGPVNPTRLLNLHLLISCLLPAACTVFFDNPHASAQSPTSTAALTTLTDKTGIRLQLIPAGKVTLGSAPGTGISEPEEQPQHDVQIAEDYYIGVTEITQKQWYSVMGTRPWRTPWNTPRLYVTEGDNYPATWITWPEARAYCERLSAAEAAVYRLPTEAEWERACRNGSATAWSFGDDASVAASNGWFRENTVTDMYSLRPREVGGKAPNSAGLLDTHGNVAEWCIDRFADYPLKDTSVPPTTLGVLRGGCWFVTHDHGRSATRDRLRIRRRLGSAGLRVVRELRGKVVSETQPTPPQPTPTPAPIPPAAANPPADNPAGNAAESSHPSAVLPGSHSVLPGCCSPVPADPQPCVPAGPFLRGPRCRIPLIPVFW
jgi:formylglycine-generating enzyme required for sulfatase activity